MRDHMISREEMAERVVEPILAFMAEGKLLWLRPWTVSAGDSGLPFNPLREARNAKDNKGSGFDGGVNNIILMIAAMVNGWDDPRWVGRTQAVKAKIRIDGVTNDKGVTIYAPIFGYGKDKDGEQIRYVRGFREIMVFNAAVFPDFPALEKPVVNPLDVVSGYERAQAMYDALAVHTEHGGIRAAYNPALDRIVLPLESSFVSADAYHGTRLHELGHATGHESRMNRNNFMGAGSTEYAYEELVAELFSAFACMDAGIRKVDMTENHAGYLQSWMSRLKDEPNAFIKASSEAWKALEYVRARIA